MQTLFIISSSAFTVGALTWFFIWALWIHPPEGWLGKEVVSVSDSAQVQNVRETAWYKWLRILTLLLGLVALTALSLMFAAHPW